MCCSVKPHKKCSNVQTLLPWFIVKMNLNWLNSVKSSNVYDIICDRVYPLITTKKRNKSTDFCYHVLLEGKVNDASRMLLCSYVQSYKKKEQYLKIRPNKGNDLYHQEITVVKQRLHLLFTPALKTLKYSIYRI